MPQIPLTCSEPTALCSALFLLYAEIHYSWPGIYNRLKRKAPEVIADTPHRIEPGQPLPVLVLVKDADRYPISLDSVVVKVDSEATSFTRKFPLRASLSAPFWHTVLEIPPEALPTGNVKVDVQIHAQRNGVAQVIHNDNYKLTSHAPFSVRLSPYALPKLPGWHYGEFHCHSSYTNDQVEFGAPLPATRHLARALGLSFFCATDHSYDLDDLPDNYLRKDPLLRKWRAFRDEVSRLNRQQSGFVVVPGEEVSAGNRKGENVHFLVLNNPDFLPGDGDGAERWFKTRPTSTIAEVLQNSNANSCAFAAHPAARPGLLERLFVGRGSWGGSDYDHTGLHGLQIWNGCEAGFEDGKRAWIEQLLLGRKLTISGGNDAHGNFNRFRQIGLPFVSMRENQYNLFGKVRTAVFPRKQLTPENLLRAIKEGNMIVTDGPFLSLEVTNENDETVGCGETIHGKRLELRMTALSSPEFGPLRVVKIMRGFPGTEREAEIVRVNNFPAPFSHTFSLELTAGQAPFYLRAEAFTRKNQEPHRCLTNPVWVEFKKYL